MYFNIERKNVDLFEITLDNTTVILTKFRRHNKCYTI